MAQGFDPAAATAAYLAQLPPEAHAKATAYTQGGHWLLLWGALATALVAWLVLRSGILVRVRRGIEGHRRRPWFAVAAVIALYSLIETVLLLPWSVYADWWRETSYGLTSQFFGGWFGEFTLTAVISILVNTVLISLLYALMRRASRTWWLWGGGVVSVFFVFIMVLGPVLVEPLFNTYREAPAGPVRDAIVEMAKANGVPHDKIYVYDGSKQSNRYTANVSGMFGTARIAMSDVMFAKGADLAEVKGVVGHEMGHYVRHHAILIALTYGLLALAGFFLIDRLFAPVQRLLGADDVQGLADPAGFPIIALLLAILGLLATPLFTSVVRMAEVDADIPGAGQRARRPLQGPGQDHRVPSRHALEAGGDPLLRPPLGGLAYPHGHGLEGRPAESRRGALRRRASYPGGRAWPLQRPSWSTRCCSRRRAIGRGRNRFAWLTWNRANIGRRIQAGTISDDHLPDERGRARHHGARRLFQGSGEGARADRAPGDGSQPDRRRPLPHRHRRLQRLPHPGL